jgi:hypothetical protein
MSVVLQGFECNGGTLQYFGNYTVTAGTGTFATADGTGSFTAQFPNAFGASAFSFAMTGNMRK